MAAPTLADRLAAARAAAGHTQAECARLLSSRFGAPARSQASVSRYLSGKQEMPVDIGHAVSQYISIFDSDDDLDDADDPAPVGEATPDFVGLVLRFSDEPLLGPRQGALVDAAVDRLRVGPPFSREDHAALTALIRILGLDA